MSCANRLLARWQWCFLPSPHIGCFGKVPLHAVLTTNSWGYGHHDIQWTILIFLLLEDSKRNENLQYTKLETKVNIERKLIIAKQKKPKDKLFGLIIWIDMNIKAKLC